MAQHSFWKGHLKLSPVTCPVATSPAVGDSARVHVRPLDRTSGARAEARDVDAETGAPVEPGDQGKRYPKDDGGFVLLEDEDLDAAAIERGAHR